MNKTIYYGDKKIKIYPKDSNKTLSGAMKVNFDDVTIELQLQVADFLSPENNRHLAIYAKKPADAFKELKKCFRYVQAAGGLIQQKENFLFIKRLGKWDLPKGKIDKGETREEAAIRECKEECGVKSIQITNTLNSTLHIYIWDNKAHLKRTYWYLMETDYNGPFTPQTEENIEEVKWFTKQEIKSEVYTNTYPAILRLLKNYFSEPPAL